MFHRTWRILRAGALAAAVVAAASWAIGTVRLGASDDELAELIRGIWSHRTDRYSELRTAETSTLRKVEMSYIGG